MASAKDIVTFIEADLSQVEIIATRPRHPIEIVEPDPSWPAAFEAVASRIRAALGDKALAIEHVGSTSVPGLPAKPVIDIDLIVADPTDEASYVPDLESAGFLFLFREKPWYEHRFFGGDEPRTNLHVWGPAAAEPARHAMFREWLKEHPEDREKYAEVKREAAEATEKVGETVQEYNLRKEWLIRQILGRIFKETGLLDAAEEEDARLAN